MLKLLTKNTSSDDFMVSEYLLEVYSSGNRDSKDKFTLKTNKYIYELELPYKNKYTNEYGFIHQYKEYNTNIKTVCDKYNINTHYYFNMDNKDKDILPYTDASKSDVNKYLPIKDYCHIY